MKLDCTDVRVLNIDAAILLALLGAVVSLVHYDDNGSVANASFLNAAHWLLVFALMGVKFDLNKYVITDVQVVYFLYGVLVGEVEIDSFFVLTPVLVSMICYRADRKLRQENSAVHNVPAASLPDDVKDGSTYNEDGV